MCIYSSQGIYKSRRNGIKFNFRTLQIVPNFEKSKQFIFIIFDFSSRMFNSMYNGGLLYHAL